jgi:hypothetical protein
MERLDRSMHSEAEDPLEEIPLLLMVFVCALLGARLICLARR